MPKKMLIDASHREETRVAVISGSKVEDFDFESLSKRPLRGNIYLARVTRVEPSLQAAFVEYGGNRHGFLAFSEIHSDYYQIPVSDREALRAAEEKEAELAKQLTALTGDPLDEDLSAAHDDDDDQDEGASLIDDSLDEEAAAKDDSAVAEQEAPDDSPDGNVVEMTEHAESLPDSITMPAEIPAVDEISVPAEADASDADDDSTEDAATRDNDEAGKNAGDGSKGKGKSNRQPSLEEQYQQARRDRIKLLKNYRIQEVIKRRQILLVQVVKEERGNKGAALTTYLSLAGRYCVLMPNTARGGGISRKISNGADRKRLRKAMNELAIPQGMGLIIRTAGSKRTKSEIKRDFDYLLRLWENIRDLTMKSIAPCLIYEEASLIKRAIRDLYDKDIGQVLVEGEAGYREAKDFMKMLMPSHAKNVQPYKEKIPLFLHYKVEQQLDEMYQPVVKLKSGGYLVIQQTEALISVDVNSGKATKERNIEATALKTNLEAAQEVARQCRLRDLAGLLVVDFIDMEENRNNRSVEKRLKDSMKQDRARIQFGRISNFGLLEMSRQRRRSGIVDGTTGLCPTCHGAGAVRSEEMAALRILRSIEEEALNGRAGVIAASTSAEVALFILNRKRDWLNRIEETYELEVEILADVRKAGDHYEIEKRGPAREPTKQAAVVTADLAELPEEEEVEETRTQDSGQDRAQDEDEKPGRKRRRRRRRKNGADNADASTDGADASSTDSAADSKDERADSADDGQDGSDDEGGRRRRRRGRRGGRRNRRRGEDTEAQSAQDDTASEGTANEDQATEDQAAKDKADKEQGANDQPDDASDAKADSADKKPAKGKSTRKPRKAKSDPEAKPDSAEATDGSDDSGSATDAASNSDQSATNQSGSRKNGRADDDQQVAAAADGEDQSDDASDLPAAANDPAPAGADGRYEDDQSEHGLHAEIPESDGDQKPKRTGWWQKALGRS